MPSYPAAIVHGDFDDDGKLDLAVANELTSSISILRGNGLGAFSNGTPISIAGTPPVALGAVDVNGDGDVDLVMAGGGGAVMYGRGDGTFSGPIFVPAGNTMNDVAIGLLDGNSVPDLVTTNDDLGNASVLLGRARTRTALVVTPNPSAVGQTLHWQAFVTRALPDSSDPSGTVQFFDGVGLMGTALVVNGVATLDLPANLLWERQLSATYLGTRASSGAFPARSRTRPMPNVGAPPANAVRSLPHWPRWGTRCASAERCACASACRTPLPPRSRCSTCAGGCLRPVPSARTAWSISSRPLPWDPASLWCASSRALDSSPLARSCSRRRA